MSMPLTAQGLTRAMARELPAVCATVLRTAASAADAPATTGEGWTVTVPFSGASTGRLVIWTDALSAAACVQRAEGEAADTGDGAVAAVLGRLATGLASAVEQTPEGAGVMAGEPSTRRSPVLDGDVVCVAIEDGRTLSFRVAAETAATSLATSSSVHSLGDSRLEAVLEVDLPLVVRFGRAVMPLRNIAELSPGAVVDMGRTPDEPVELLVGERLVARGEVVIVGGNYGVRITEITSGRRSTDLEARA